MLGSSALRIRVRSLTIGQRGAVVKPRDAPFFPRSSYLVAPIVASIGCGVAFLCFTICCVGRRVGSATAANQLIADGPRVNAVAIYVDAKESEQCRLAAGATGGVGCGRVTFGVHGDVEVLSL